MKNERVDGMDVLQVREAALRVIDEIRNGSGPQLLEIMTYRYRGHSMGDPERYRKAAEVHKWQEEDPIGIYRKYLLAQGIADEAGLDQQDDSALNEVTDAVEFAESSPEPGPEELFQNIYVEE